MNDQNVQTWYGSWGTEIHLPHPVEDDRTLCGLRRGLPIDHPNNEDKCDRCLERATG